MLARKAPTLVMGIPDLIQARKWLDSKDWETEIKGIDIIVTLARKYPDVSFIKTQKQEENCTSFNSLCLQFQVLRNDMKNVIRLMIEEVKNLRSQVRIVLYVSLKNIFEHDELTLSTESILKKDQLTYIHKVTNTRKILFS